MKGIILAGGSGSRLRPITLGVSKQLLPIYDKPMIYYPLSVLMLAGIKDILVITNPEHQESFVRLLGSGEHLGVNISFQVQQYPRGLADAFLIGEEFIGDDNVALVLGDNIFWGHGLRPLLRDAVNSDVSATIFGYKVNNPSQFGVVEVDAQKCAVSIEEKPSFPRSDIAITGLYFFNNDVIKIAKTVVPSQRGELEITSVINHYLKTDSLAVETLGRGFAWLDTGTCESLLEASSFVATIEKRQGYKIACIEEIAWNQGWITAEEMMQASQEYGNSDYGSYLKSLLEKI